MIQFNIQFKINSEIFIQSTNSFTTCQQNSIQYSIQEFGGKWFKMPSGPEYVLSAQN